MTKQLIEIKMPKCTLFFTQQELQQLLARDPALWAEALRRGKGVKRWEAISRNCETAKNAMSNPHARVGFAWTKLRNCKNVHPVQLARAWGLPVQAIFP